MCLPQLAQALTYAEIVHLLPFHQPHPRKANIQVQLTMLHSILKPNTTILPVRRQRHPSFPVKRVIESSPF